MKCIAIDDEPLALKQITKFIQQTPSLELVASLPDTSKVMRYLTNQKIDVLFIDINLHGTSGLEFVKTLETNRPFIVFTTAYAEYAVEGFKVAAVDYLLKPFGYKDFLRAVSKVEKLYNVVTETQTADNIKKSNTLFVKTDYKMVQLNIENIVYIESQSDYVRVVLDDTTSLMTLISLRTLEEKLPSDFFMRVHRSYIINLKKVSSVVRSKVSLVTGEEIPVGEQYKDKLSDYVDTLAIS